MSYSPDFELFTNESRTLKNKNDQDYIERIKTRILDNLQMIDYNK